jgi:predicted glycosyltransferase
MTRRLFIYSHDTFGLGHLKRSRTIAAAVVAACSDVSALIATGSPLADEFSVLPGVDIVRLPAVLKKPEGGYAPAQAGLSLGEAIALRSQLLMELAADFRPDVLLVDKEPLGLCGELTATLEAEALRGTRLVLGVRDVLDEAQQLRTEWGNSGALAALARYHALWVYGHRDMYDPLQGLDISADVAARVKFLGYLRSSLPAVPEQPGQVLVTAGGGGDGEALLLAMVRAARHFPQWQWDIVTGPFIPEAAFAGLEAASAAAPNVTLRRFVPDMGARVAQASLVVAMAGYNTFCDVLSGQKRVLFVPRIAPRQEQWIRAKAAEKLGLAQVLHPDMLTNDDAVIRALEQASRHHRPSADFYEGLLGGIPAVQEAVGLVF